MRAKAILAALLLAGWVSGAVADDNTPAYVQTAWRARLITMAPACHVKDAAWADKAETAITAEALGSSADPLEKKVASLDRDTVEQAKGAIAMAKYAGTKLAGISNGALCKGLISRLVIENTDGMISRSEKLNIRRMPGTAIEPSKYMITASWAAFMVAADVACGRNDETWGTERFGDALMSANATVDSKSKGQIKGDAQNNAVGMVQMAYYVGLRAQADFPESLCQYVQTKASQKMVNDLISRHNRLFKSALTGLATPDD